MAKEHGFRRECVDLKYTESVYESCLDLFTALPLAAVLDEEIFCVQSGISPDDLAKIADINALDRFEAVEIPIQGPLADLMYSRPEQDAKSNDKEVGHTFFSPEALEAFFRENGLTGMIRGHRLSPWGIHKQIPEVRNSFLISLCSAPNFGELAQNHGMFCEYYDPRRLYTRAILPSKDAPIRVWNHLNILDAANDYLADMAEYLLVCFDRYLSYKIVIQKRMKKGVEDVYNVPNLDEFLDEEEKVTPFQRLKKFIRAKFERLPPPGKVADGSICLDRLPENLLKPLDVNFPQFGVNIFDLKDAQTN